MKTYTYLAFVVIAVALIYTILPGFSSATEGSGRKIVVYEDGILVEERDTVTRDILSKRIKRIEQALSADVFEGLTESEVASLAQDPRIKRIDDDVVVYALDLGSREIETRILNRAQSHKPSDPVSIQSQTLPWGIDRVDAELVWPSGNNANTIKVGVIDTGISLSHPDLKNNIKGQYNAIRPWRSAEDDNGHGSHVAGIIGALNNTSGVVGVGPEIDLYAIKVLGASGSGYLSDIIEGIDWAIGRGLQVINMSLGTGSNIESFHDAVIRAYNAGIVVVAAAGNSGGAVIYPAAYPEAIAVSATDSNNAIASFSSRGPEVDISAPGVSIYSTYKGKGYATLSGTSMATPHVAGGAALVLSTAPGVYDVDGDSLWDPDEVKQKLQDSALDLGVGGYDTLFGWGLLNVYTAVQ